MQALKQYPLNLDELSTRRQGTIPGIRRGAAGEPTASGSARPASLAERPPGERPGGPSERESSENHTRTNLSKNFEFRYSTVEDVVNLPRAARNSLP